MHKATIHAKELIIPAMHKNQFNIIKNTELEYKN